MIGSMLCRAQVNKKLPESSTGFESAALRRTTSKKVASCFDRSLGSCLVLDGTDDGREDCATGATSDHLRDNAAHAQVSGLRRRHDGRQQQRDDLSEHTASDQAGNNVSNCTKIKVRR